MIRHTIQPEEIPQVRRWHGHDLPPHEEMLMFHRQTGPVPDTLRRLCKNLEEAGIEYVVIGAFALGCHSYARATNDVDLCVRPSDLERFVQRFLGREYQAVAGRRRRFFDPATGVTFDLLPTGALAGRVSRNPAVRFPDPAEAVEIQGLRTVSLPRLVELKLVTWRHRDWADVIELIRANKLGEDFALQLDAHVRMAYLQCYDQMREEEEYEQDRDEL